MPAQNELDPAGSNGAVFHLDNVSYAYEDGTPGLHDISLSLQPGESLAILGSNGSGKSTLLKILDGLYFPAAGVVTAFGQPLTEEALRDDAVNFAFRKRVGLVFQDSDVQLFSPSVWDEVAFAPLQLGLDRAAVIERTRQAMQALDIVALSERAPHRLSGGEKKRVALASVLSQSPEVWLLDEPTAGLDPRTAAWLTRFINTQVQEGHSLVIATHDLELVRRTAGRVLLLGEDHCIAAEGRAADLLGDLELLDRHNLINMQVE